MFSLVVGILWPRSPSPARDDDWNVSAQCVCATWDRTDGSTV